MKTRTSKTVIIVVLAGVAVVAGLIADRGLARLGKIESSVADLAAAVSEEGTATRESLDGMAAATGEALAGVAADIRWPYELLTYEETRDKCESAAERFADDEAFIDGVADFFYEKTRTGASTAPRRHNRDVEVLYGHVAPLALPGRLPGVAVCNVGVTAIQVGGTPHGVNHPPGQAPKAYVCSPPDGSNATATWAIHGYGREDASGCLAYVNWTAPRTGA